MVGFEVEQGERIAISSIGIDVAVPVLKRTAWFTTGSAALFFDALESSVNVVASVVALGGVHLASIPPDANHPYGHDEAEFFAAVIEGVLIVVAAPPVFRDAWIVWHNLHPLRMPFVGIRVTAIATLLNRWWSAMPLGAGKRLHSPALLADRRHLVADVLTSAGIALGVVLAVVSGQLWLDPLLAAATGVYVLWSGTISASVGGSMDAAPEPTIVLRIRERAAESAAGAIEAHDLRMRHAGKLRFRAFHRAVPGSMTVADSHPICDRIEHALKPEIGHPNITIHVEPPEKAKQHGGPVV